MPQVYYYIRGTAYELFSIERAEWGGMRKADAIAQLKAAGIKVSTHKDYCYTPYVGHYALLVEASKVKEAQEILFG